MNYITVLVFQNKYKYRLTYETKPNFTMRVEIFRQLSLVIRGSWVLSYISSFAYNNGLLIC